MVIRNKTLILAPLVAAAVLGSMQALAAGHGGFGEGMHYDNRFSHNQYYHDRGYSMAGIPHGA